MGSLERRKSTRSVLFLFCAGIAFGGFVRARENISSYKEIDKNGYTQIVYKKGGKKVQITDEQFPHTDPKNSESFIVWASQVGQYWQIFYYNVAAERTVQLTSQENNVNPQIFGKYIVWEGQRNGVWQIFLFDGVRTKPVTSGVYPSQDVAINDGYVAFSRKSVDNKWKVYYYDISSEDLVNLTPAESGKKPIIKNGQIVWYSTEQDKRNAVFYRYDLNTKLKYREGTLSEKGVISSNIDHNLERLAAEQGSGGSGFRLNRDNIYKIVTVDDIKEEISEIQGVNESTASETDTFEEDVDSVVEAEETRESTSSHDEEETTEETTEESTSSED